jgi:hypothetical protein
MYQKLLDQILASEPKNETRLAAAFDLSHLQAAIAILHRRTGRADLASALEERRLKWWAFIGIAGSPTTPLSTNQFEAAHRQ